MVKRKPKATKDCVHTSMLKTRDENRSIQKKSVHMFNVWMLPDLKFNIRSTAVSIEDRDSKPQCRIHCDHLLMSRVWTGWVATFHPLIPVITGLIPGCFQKEQTHWLLMANIADTLEQMEHVKKQLCHPVKVLTSRLNQFRST